MNEETGQRRFARAAHWLRAFFGHAANVGGRGGVSERAYRRENLSRLLLVVEQISLRMRVCSVVSCLLLAYCVACERLQQVGAMHQDCISQTNKLNKINKQTNLKQKQAPEQRNANGTRSNTPKPMQTRKCERKGNTTTHKQAREQSTDRVLL